MAQTMKVWKIHPDRPRRLSVEMTLDDDGDLAIGWHDEGLQASLGDIGVMGMDGAVVWPDDGVAFMEAVRLWAQRSTYFATDAKNPLAE